MDGLDILNENVGSEAKDDLPATQAVDDRVLKGVVAYVEVRSTNDNRSEAVRKELAQLGAIVVKKFTPDVTHVVFKEGSNRTKTKAQKKGIHLVSVLWVENCKLNQEHVSERMYPAVVPRLKGTPLLMTKLKKAKSMQPRDFEEELANSAERVGRKRKKHDALNRLKSTENTPSSSPRAIVLVQDTQPRSPDDGFVLTPIRLTIPDTPPSMREKMRKIKLAKEGAAGSYTAGELDDHDAEDKHIHLKQLQKKLFKSVAFSGNCSSTTQSPDASSVFMSDSDNDQMVEVEGPANKIDNSKKSGLIEHNVSIDSESSVNNDIFKLAQNINATLNSQLNKSGTGAGMFGVDSDENLLSSQEIKTVVNVPVKLKQHAENECDTQNLESGTKDPNNVGSCSGRSVVVKKTSQKHKTDMQNEETLTERKQRRRSSRRLSVQQAVQELDTSTILNLLPEEDEDENPIADLSCSKENSSQKSKVNNENVPVRQEKTMKKGRNSKGKLNETAKSNGKRASRNSISPRNSKALPENDMESIEKENEKSEQNESKLTTCKATNVKKSMKKKLLSLTDLTEQHSVLVEPTKCSTDERPQLEPTKTKRGRKKKTSSDNSSACIEDEADANKDALDNRQNINNDENGKDKVKNTVENKTSRKRKPDEESGKDAKCAVGRKKRSSVVGETGQRKVKKGKKALVNETHVDEADETVPNVDQTPMTKVQDVTTQLNLTKDNSLVCSIRETTLSLSMSTAYTDANMPSFLISQRRSIDEFSASQRQNKKKKLRDRSVLTSISELENSNDHSSSDSDRSVNSGKRRGKVSVSQHRKIVRPSLVMTSLHSYEQDVVISVIKKLGGFVIAENVNETTTHIICGESRRTLNVLYGLARGIWLLSKEWVLNSLEAGKWIPESEFECTDTFPACKVVRLEHEKSPEIYRQSLFKGIGRVYISGRSQPPRQHLVQLLRLCGGQVIGIREKASIYLGTDYHPGMTCVKTNWLLAFMSVIDAEILSREMHFDENMTVNIVDEWKVYQTDDLKEEDRIDHYWRQVFVKKLDSGQLKYRFLPQIVKKALVLPHGNSEVERSLSVNTSVVTKDRVALGEKTVTAIRTVKDIVKFSDPVDEQPHKIPLNSEILLAAKMAHNKYKQRIVTEKEEREKKKQEREKERLEKKRLEELATEEKNKTSSMLEKEKALLKKEMEIQTRLTVAEELLKDGKKKLSKAVESSNMKGASVAQMMIATATSKIEGIKKEMDRVRENKREVEQQKRQLLVNRLDKCSSKSSSRGKKQQSAISSSKSSATASTRTSKSEPDKQAASSSKSSPSSEKHLSKRKNEDKETDAKKSKKV